MKATQFNNESMNVVINASLLAALQNINAGTFAHIEYDGIEKLPQKLGINGVVTKHSSGMVQLNYDYQNAVNNRLEKQGSERSFEAQSLPWGKWFIFNVIIAHNNETYLRFYSFKGSKIETSYFVNGRKATPEEDALIRAYKANKKKGSNTQTEAGLEENQVKPCNVNTKNIISLNCGTCQYHRKDKRKEVEVVR